MCVTKPPSRQTTRRFTLLLPACLQEFFEEFLLRGLAVVSMDIRGSGASFGVNRGPWLPEETQDSLELCDWIVQQPWSNGRIGTWGIRCGSQLPLRPWDRGADFRAGSYEGTAALLTTTAEHPSIVCCCPMYIFLVRPQTLSQSACRSLTDEPTAQRFKDVYRDVGFPGVSIIAPL
jgi:hypothetical protein